MGYDVHKFAEGDHVWLCGIKVAHTHALEGHSDADVGLHAITDALLGTIGEGDIGQHFPPTDARWKCAPSWKFLDHAAGLVRAKGGVINHVDVTLICERPKIGPHRDAMKLKIAEILNIDPGRVSVKATTTEGHGLHRPPRRHGGPGHSHRETLDMKLPRASTVVASVFGIGYFPNSRPAPS